ncbi:S8 family serine peptidase [Saccharopolyspora indica]|uniref:S8 family serine peptidase n=1 Tax=Saccharopolyspora indica TaxID=1229659 RepID=UPI0022EB87E6|nr:S8 family serine peptidase [Saccharopolyspora indica]MDA3649887.1 S8 family serine peptidase [Saccharopolyspora indica]
MSSPTPAARPNPGASRALLNRTSGERDATPPQETPKRKIAPNRNHHCKSRRGGLALAAVLGIAAATTPAVAVAQPIGQCTPPSETPVTTASWAQERMAADRAWPLTRGDVIVGVVDTGVSATAPALSGAVLSGTDLRGGPGNGDCFGRGTFLASLIAARPSSDPHVPFAGVAPEAKIFPVRVSDDPPKIQDHAGLANSIAKGIKAAVDGGARVVAVGLVATLDMPDLRAAIAYASERDVLVIAPAAVPKKGQLAFPARIPGVLAVAPVGPEGPVQSPTYGADPAIAAPAQQLVGVAPQGAGHRLSSGNELSVAYVAGAAALVRAYHPALPAPEVAARLLNAADHPSTPLPNEVIGYGVVDPFAAVTTIPNTDPPATPLPEALAVPKPAVPDPAPATRALWLAGALAAAALLLAGPVIAAAARRRREN